MKRTWFCNFAAKKNWLLCLKTNMFSLNLLHFWIELSSTTTYASMCCHYHLLSRGYCSPWYAIETLDIWSFADSKHFIDGLMKWTNAHLILTSTTGSPLHFISFATPTVIREYIAPITSPTSSLTRDFLTYFHFRLSSNYLFFFIPDNVLQSHLPIGEVFF